METVVHSPKSMTNESWKDTFARHLGEYARHERLYDEPFSEWAIKFIDTLRREAKQAGIDLTLAALDSVYKSKEK